MKTEKEILLNFYLYSLRLMILMKLASDMVASDQISLRYMGYCKKSHSTVEFVTE